MSNYIKQTKHPHTGKWEEANWIDDLFGKHKYGVVFLSDKRKYGENTPLRVIAFDPEKIKIET